MNNPFDNKKHHGFFEGWYFKQQNTADTLALIPALHISSTGKASASLQLITDTEVYNVPFSARSFHTNRNKGVLSLGNCVFSGQGCNLNIANGYCSLQGTLRFGPLTPPAYDIMGPFRFVPFMECRHHVFSLTHRVDGMVRLNGKPYFFRNSNGYIEGDRGFSFPRRYIWTQCSWKGNSLMFSIAEIPLGNFHIIGCTGFLYLHGKERRIATYCGAKPLHVGVDAVIIRQGALLLIIKPLETRNDLLRAPQNGSMARRIHESVSCRVHYTCMDGNTILFDFISDTASFENNWRNCNESAGK